MYATTSRLEPVGGAGNHLACAGRDGPDRPERVPEPWSPGDDVTWRLPHCPQAVGTAREITAAVLNDWHVAQDSAEAAVLVVSELVTNAVEHALPPIALHLHRERAGERVWVGVTDSGPAAGEGAWTASCADDEHGRGLDVIDALTTTHGTRSHSGGTTHWARLPGAG
ncbi:ATP-binding protein [Streptomyces sp. NPDC002793]|uniref:ATP-binding protein n=1 Tax=Streptomyces TaxID=1883 RepID=UPI003321E706